ncbi:MAG: iron chaperone [Sediminispirochaetaceae bacterium]
MHSDAETVAQYLDSLSPERRGAIEKVRKVILSNLPDGYEEVMAWGMITYQVPLEICPDTYNGKPLMYAALAAQKNHMAVYLSSIYLSEEKRQRFEEAYRRTGKRYDAGKSCVRFRRIDDLPLELIGKAVAELSPEDFAARVKEVQCRRERKEDEGSRGKG